MKPKISRLRTQGDVESLFQSLEWKDAHKKERAVKYHQTILDKVGLDGNEGKTLANLKKRKAEAWQEQEEEHLTQEAMIDARKEIRHDYLETLGYWEKSV